MASISGRHLIKIRTEQSDEYAHEKETIMLHAIEESMDYLLTAPARSIDTLPVLNIFEGNA